MEMMKKRHHLPEEKLELRNVLHDEKHLLAKADVPVVTISATYRKELADRYMSIYHTNQDVVFSRAHFSMAEAVHEAAKELKYKSEISDPTNFVSDKDWGKVEFTEKMGQLMARYKVLKWLKDQVDTVVRNKLPITEAIIDPLLYVTKDVKCPVVSLHYEVGNILIPKGKKVVQVVTDPHVRPQYLDSLPAENVVFAVFDEETKQDFYAKAKKLGKEVGKDQVVVTGPPVDPRIARLAKNKKAWRKGEPIHLGITTGGLGTNLNEIKKVLDEFRPLLKPPEKIRLFLYAGTHRDFRNFFEEYAEENHIRIGNLDDEGARIRILYEDSIVDANNNLIKYMFPWAHGVITKPSGDMAYDAAAAGCFLLMLEPWGVWEENIQKRFIKRGVGFDFKVDEALHQFNVLRGRGSLRKAMKAAKDLPDLFRDGAKEIVKLQQGRFCEK